MDRTAFQLLRRCVNTGDKDGVQLHLKTLSSLHSEEEIIRIFMPLFKAAVEGEHYEVFNLLLKDFLLLEPFATPAGKELCKELCRRITWDALCISAMRGYDAGFKAFFTATKEGTSKEERLKLLLDGVESSASGGYTDPTFGFAVGSTGEEEDCSRLYDDICNARATGGYARVLEYFILGGGSLAASFKIDDFESVLSKALIASATVGYSEVLKPILFGVKHLLMPDVQARALLEALTVSAAGGDLKLLSHSHTLPALTGENKYINSREKLLREAQTNGGYTSVVNQLLERFMAVAANPGIGEEFTTGIYKSLCISVKAGCLGTFKPLLDALTKISNTQGIRPEALLSRVFGNSFKAGDSEGVRRLLKASIEGENIVIIQQILDATKNISTPQYINDVLEAFHASVEGGKSLDIVRNLSDRCFSLLKDGFKDSLRDAILASATKYPRICDLLMEVAFSTLHHDLRYELPPKGISLISVVECGNSGPGKCSICNKQIDGNAKRLLCGHYYCLSSCIDDWVEEQLSCPKCISWRTGA